MEHHVAAAGDRRQIGGEFRVQPVEPRPQPFGVGGVDGGAVGIGVAQRRGEALVSGNSYNIQNVARSWEPAPAEQEAVNWYRYYFHSERGRRGLIKDRRDIARLLWRMWSPTWKFDAATFDRTAEALENPDFVEVAVHSYRHRYGLVAGDPAVVHIETRLTAQPDISVSSMTVDGDRGGLSTRTDHHAKKFSGPHRHRVFENAGHNLPQEDPRGWAQAVLDARATATG